MPFDVLDSILLFAALRFMKVRDDFAAKRFRSREMRSHILDKYRK